MATGILCLISGSCESTFEKQDPFKVTSLGPLADEIPFEELGAGKIVFFRNDLSDSSGCYVIDIDQKRSYGFRLHSSIRMPNISPDGSKIACSLNDSPAPFPTWNIYCMDIDGTNCFPVSASGEIFPTWTPDGSHIICYLRELDGPLYMLPASENPSERVEMIRFYYGDDPDWCIDPSGGFSMSPDGQLVCVGMCGAKTSGLLKIEPFQGKSGVSLLLPKKPNEGPLVSAFSPDGRKIAYAVVGIDSIQQQGIMWIKSMDADGTNQAIIASINLPDETMLYSYWHGFPLISLCWSPDSGKILFNAPNEQDFGFHLMAVNADGSGLIQVTDELSGNDVSVSWGR